MPQGFTFDEAFPDALRVAGVKVRVAILESLCRFKVCAHIKNRVLFDLFESLVYIYVSKNVISVSVFLVEMEIFFLR